MAFLHRKSVEPWVRKGPMRPPPGAPRSARRSCTSAARCAGAREGASSSARAAGSGGRRLRNGATPWRSGTSERARVCSPARAAARIALSIVGSTTRPMASARLGSASGTGPARPAIRRRRGCAPRSSTDPGVRQALRSRTCAANGTAHSPLARRRVRPLHDVHGRSIAASGHLDRRGPAWPQPRTKEEILKSSPSRRAAARPGREDARGFASPPRSSRLHS